jgi:hypothetical protein
MLERKLGRGHCPFSVLRCVVEVLLVFFNARRHQMIHAVIPSFGSDMLDVILTAGKFVSLFIPLYQFILHWHEDLDWHVQVVNCDIRAFMKNIQCEKEDCTRSVESCQ